MKKTITKAIMVAIAAVITSCAQIAEKQMDDVTTKVAIESEEQYQVIAAGGDKTEMAVYAGVCAASWAEAKNMEKYKEWKALESKLYNEAAGK